MNRFRSLVLLCALGLAPRVWTSDVFILKHDPDRQLEGDVVGTTADGYILKTREGQVHIKKAEVLKRIEGAGATDEMFDAEAALGDRRYVQALTLFRDAMQEITTEEQRVRVVDGIQKATRQWLDSTDPNRLDRLEELSQLRLADMSDLMAVDQYLEDAELVERFRTRVKNLEQATGERLLAKARTTAAQDEYADAQRMYEQYLGKWPQPNVARELAELRVEWAEVKLRENPALAKEKATQAIKGLEGLDAPTELAMAYLALGRANLRLREYSEAAVNLQRAQDGRDRLTSAQLLVLDSALEQVRRIKSRPTFKPVDFRTVRTTPIPRPIRELTFKERTERWRRDARRAIAKGDWWDIASRYALPVGITIAVLVVFWHLPHRYARKHASGRTAIAANWPRIVFWTGILGLLAYWVAAAFGREKLERCPTCKGNLSNLNLYDNYRFDCCPHCGHRVKPAFSLRAMAETAAKVQARGQGREGGESGWESMMEILTMTFLDAFRSRSSEIHFEPQADRLRVRYRIDGMSYDTLTFPSELCLPVISALKGRASLDITEKRMPQDGLFATRLDDVELDIRISTLSAQEGEKVVLRFMDRRKSGMRLLETGFPENVSNLFMDSVLSARGMIVVSGPEGSGKTTLLYSVLRQLNDGTRSVVTLEDPIEYDIPGIGQIQHNVATGLTFSTALRSVLRQEPDVIMFEEIRDEETTALAIEAAQAGRMVLSALQTPDTPSALGRLLEMRVERGALADTLLCVVAQRLVRRLCPECKKRRRATARDLERIGRSRWLQPKAPIFEAQGCDNCQDTGYRGRTGIFEVLPVTDDIRGAIANGVSPTEVAGMAWKAGMATLREEGLKNVVEGITSLDEIFRVVQGPDRDAESSDPGK